MSSAFSFGAFGEFYKNFYLPKNIDIFSVGFNGNLSLLDIFFPGVFTKWKKHGKL